MPASNVGRSITRRGVTRHDFLTQMATGTAAAAALTAGRPSRALGQSPSHYPDWIAPSAKPPKRGGTLTRASAWDRPVLDPRLTNSVGLFQ